MSEITRNPLSWPENVARTAPHLRSTPRFDDRSLSVASYFVIGEINRLNNRHRDFSDESVIISSNLRLKQDGTPNGAQGEPADTGVSVYFTLRINRNGRLIERPVVRACDKWRKTSDNLYAIGLDIECDRAKFRYGASNIEQSFRGYLAIPERCNGEPWWTILGIASSASREVVETAYRSRAKMMHPDTGGSEEKFSKLSEAYDQALAQFR